MVRLVRNLAGVPFAWRADARTLDAVHTRCLTAIRAGGWRLREVPGSRIRARRKAWLLPPRPGESRAPRLYHSPGRDRIPEWVVLINGVDHLLIQHTRPGLCAGPVAAATLARAGRLGRYLPWARAPHWSWLAASPADCGPGVRVLWRIGAPPSPAGDDRLIAAGLAAIPALTGARLVTHRRPLAGSILNALRRYEEVLLPRPRRR